MLIQNNGQIASQDFMNYMKGSHENLSQRALVFNVNKTCNVVGITLDHKLINIISGKRMPIFSLLVFWFGLVPSVGHNEEEHRLCKGPSALCSGRSKEPIAQFAT
jgi:hypothetical protein